MNASVTYLSGWICPRCQKVHSPSTPLCLCSPASDEKPPVKYKYTIQDVLNWLRVQKIGDLFDLMDAFDTNAEITLFTDGSGTLKANGTTLDIKMECDDVEGGEVWEPLTFLRDQLGRELPDYHEQTSAASKPAQVLDYLRYLNLHAIGDAPYSVGPSHEGDTYYLYGAFTREHFDGGDAYYLYGARTREHFDGIDSLLAYLEKLASVRA